MLHHFFNGIVLQLILLNDFPVYLSMLFIDPFELDLTML